ncbi:MAG: hypothetical protein GY830_02755 [Bacteroidetes bacterium]|nr:hypothetical protein [Bacteroidota bacterium]
MKTFNIYLIILISLFIFFSCSEKNNFKGTHRVNTDKAPKEQLRSQQDNILRLQYSLLKEHLKFENNQHCNINNKNNQYFTNEMSKIDNKNEWLYDIVDDVIKKYEVLDFKTDPIGTKRSIYVDKQSIKLFLKQITNDIKDEANLYYWLDYTTTLQMSQGYSNQYKNIENKEFMVAIINYELKNDNDENLYGIIKEQQKRYPYKLEEFMTKYQIKTEYNILYHDLPKKSRKNKEFINKLLLRRKISKEDINKIKWSNLKLFKSQKSDDDSDSKSIVLTQSIMKEYTIIAMEKFKNKKYVNNNLIPILVIDKSSSYYGIEWVLIINIIYRNCDVGISFRYDEKSDIFIATAIYLDKEEIESKHKLIGLTFDYCKNLNPFSLRKFKFKSKLEYQELMRHKEEIERCKKEIEREKQIIQELNDNDWYLV